MIFKNHIVYLYICFNRSILEYDIYIYMYIYNLVYFNYNI